MASIYPRNGILYISWYDWLKGKSLNRSTELKDNPQNRRQAKRLAEELENQLKEKKEKYRNLKLKKSIIAQCFDRFMKLNNDKNDNTKDGYLRFYRRFKVMFPPEAEATIITKDKVEEWLMDLRELPYQRNTLHGYVKILKKFLSFLFEYNYIPTFTINKELIIRPEVKKIITFSLDDIELLFKNLNTKNSNFKIMFYTLFYTGLRPSDIIDIKVEDIMIKEKTLGYYSIKSKEYNKIPLHNELIPVLKDRIEEVKEGRIFDYNNYRHMGRAFKRYLQDLGLDNKGYNLRTFRKTFISLGYENGMEIAIVSKLVGHKNIQTTMKYYNKISISHQSQELNKFKIPSRIDVKK